MGLGGAEQRMGGDHFQAGGVRDELYQIARYGVVQAGFAMLPVQNLDSVCASRVVDVEAIANEENCEVCGVN